MEITEKDIKRIFTNPFYCLGDIHPIMCTPHEPIVTEEQFIATGKRMIEEDGAEEYIRNLLENLKGNYVA